MNTYILARITNGVDRRSFYTLAATAKGWESYKKNYRIPASDIQKVVTVKAKNLGAINRAEVQS